MRVCIPDASEAGIHGNAIRFVANLLFEATTGNIRSKRITGGLLPDSDQRKDMRPTLAGNCLHTLLLQQLPHLTRRQRPRSSPTQQQEQLGCLLQLLRCMDRIAQAAAADDGAVVGQ